MQRDQQFYPKKAVLPFVNEGSKDYMHIPVASAFGVVLPLAANPSMPINGVELQPSEVCPKNFIILDQTCQQSRILFNPASAHKFDGPSLNLCATYIQDIFERKNVTETKREMSSSLKEDSDDIDVLLSLEEEDEDYDEEEVSTARTYGNYGSNSPDSSCSYGSEPQKKKSTSSKLNSSGSSGNSNNERKRRKMKKMVKALRGIVPGSDQMNTVAVLDEAVRYLKSLKVEVQKRGIGNFKN